MNLESSPGGALEFAGSKEIRFKHWRLLAFMATYSVRHFAWGDITFFTYVVPN